MYRITFIQVRPDLSVSFYKKPTNIDSIINSYKANNKIINISQRMSQDLLTRTSIIIFDSKASYEEYAQISDIVEMSESRKIFCDERNISIQVIKEEVTE